MNTHALDAAPVGSVIPRGWTRRWLELQKRGLTGHLEVAGYPYDTKLWACAAIPRRRGHGAPWWPYEQTGYWIDGLTRLGLLLDDEELKGAAKRQIDYVLAHADRDGYLGPKSCKPFMPAGRWSHQIFFRALVAWHEATGDRRIVPALAKHYLGRHHDHGGHRDVCNIEIMCWVYGRTGDRRLLRLAEKTWETYQRTGEDDDRAQKTAEITADRPAQSHGVTFCETVKQGAILYLASGKKRYLDHTVAGFAKLDKYHMMPAGGPSSTESLRTTTSLDATEMCDYADYTWSARYLLTAAGDPRWADRIERAVYNGFFGAVTKDFRALQYFSGPNQVTLGRHSNHTLAATGGAWMTYRPKPGTECCTGEVNRVMPNFVCHQWMMKRGGPAATLYGPCRFGFDRGASRVSITEETCYPFGDTVDFVITPPLPDPDTLGGRLGRKIETIELVPFGCTLLRVGMFPLARP